MSTAEPTTSLAATVADEQDEIMAESSASAATSAPAPTVAPTSTDETAPASEAVDGEKPEGDAEEEEKKVDPNALPEDACVTLYLQNLNEKVRLPGQLFVKRRNSS